MSVPSDDHSIHKVRTFKADVERAQIEGVTAPTPEEIKAAQKERAAKKKAPSVTYTPAATVDASRKDGVRSALTYLNAVGEETESNEVTPTAEVASIDISAEIAPTTAAEKATPSDEPSAPASAAITTVPPKKIESTTPDKEGIKKSEAARTPFAPPDILAAEIETLTAATKKPSLLSDTDAVYEANEEEGMETGTIIKDKKRKRRGFIVALGTLIGRGFRSTTKALTPKPQPSDAAPETTQTDTPHEAAVAVSAPKDDFVEVVRERVRASQAAQTIPTLAVKKKNETEESAGWTHVVTGDTAPNSTAGTPFSAPNITPLTPLTPIETPAEVTPLSGGPLWQIPRAASSRIAISKPVDGLTHTSTPSVRIPVIPTPVPPVPAPLPSPVVVAPEPVIEKPKPIAPIISAPAVTAEPIKAPQPSLTMVNPKPIALPIDDAPSGIHGDMPTAAAYIKSQEPAPPPPPVVVPVLEVLEAPAVAAPEPEPAAQPVTTAAPELPLAPPAAPTGPLSPSGFRRLEIREGLKAAKNAPTNSLALAIMIIVGAITLGVIVSFHFFTTTIAPNDSVSIAQPPTLIMVTKQLPLTLTNNRSELLDGIHAILEQETETVQIYPTALGERSREEAADAATILAVFDPNIDGTFTRSITALTFGGTGTAEPFIILKAAEFDTAFAGMLGWETNMSADLAPLFGSTVAKTLDPQARTTAENAGAFFVDGIIANRSARILYDELGLERLVYVFVDQQTILITTNRTAVERLVPNIR